MVQTFKEYLFPIDSIALEEKYITAENQKSEGLLNVLVVTKKDNGQVDEATSIEITKILVEQINSIDIDDDRVVFQFLLSFIQSHRKDRMTLDVAVLFVSEIGKALLIKTDCIGCLHLTEGYNGCEVLFDSEQPKYDSLSEDNTVQLRSYLIGKVYDQDLFIFSNQDKLIQIKHRICQILSYKSTKTQKIREIHQSYEQDPEQSNYCCLIRLSESDSPQEGSSIKNSLKEVIASVWIWIVLIGLLLIIGFLFFGYKGLFFVK